MVEINDAFERRVEQWSEIMGFLIIAKDALHNAAEAARAAGWLRHGAHYDYLSLSATRAYDDAYKHRKAFLDNGTDDA